jgi:hypothetical protein
MPLCGATESRLKGCKFAPDEESLTIFGDYQRAGKPIDVESPISDALDIPNIPVSLAGSGQPPLAFVDISIERIDNITVDKQDETFKHGTEGYEEQNL